MENLVTWYKFTFAVCCKHDAYSLLCVLSLNVKFSGVQILLLHAISHTLPLFYLLTYILRMYARKNYATVEIHP